jgi:D-mannonate dehydratase
MMAPSWKSTLRKTSMCQVPTICFNVEPNDLTTFQIDYTITEGNVAHER